LDLGPWTLDFGLFETEFMLRKSLYFTGPCRLELREEPLDAPGPGQVLVRTLMSAISPGTEMLIYRGQAPREMAADTALTALPGSLAFPLKYGYAAVGQVMELGRGVAPGWEGRLVFAFHPHESHFLATPDELLQLPGDLTPDDAVFFPNMETAVTFLLDGQPLMGEQVAIFGQGIVGLLLTALLSRWPLSSLVTLDLYPKRRLLSENLGAHVSLDPAAPDAMARLAACLQGAGPYPGADLCYEVSGNPAALDQAIAAHRVSAAGWSSAPGTATKPRSCTWGGCFIASAR
jgi:threonine dehydrogenase-like Zn-dependent dehydrogenase